MMRSLTKNLIFYRTFGKLAFNPFETSKPPSSSDELNNVVDSIYKWAR